MKGEMLILTIIDTRKMSKSKLVREIDKCRDQIEKLGMGHKEACELVVTIMNLGISIEKKINKDRES